MLTIEPRHMTHTADCIVMGPDGTPICTTNHLPIGDISRVTPDGRARLCELLEMTPAERAADYAEHADRP